jgi:hypothetical protein
MSDAHENHGGGGGVPAPARTMWADTSQMYESAHAWEWEVSQALSAAATQVAAGLGEGRLFGVALRALGDGHDAFVERATGQLRAGANVAGEMGSRLRGVADDWVRTDEGAAELHDRLRAHL